MKGPVQNNPAAGFRLVAHLPAAAAWGALAGIGGASVMSVYTSLARRRLPPEQQYPLPPQQIAVEAARRAGWERLVRPAAGAYWAGVVGHVVYSLAAGALYGAFLSGERLPAALKGALFGLALWTGSYLGWAPALGLLPPAHQQPAERSRLMILANVLWGTATAILMDCIQRRRTYANQY